MAHKMESYKVAQLDEIDVVDDGRCPFRPTRVHHPEFAQTTAG